MSVVVWDGKSLAVDCGATDGVTMWEIDKAWEFGDEVITGVGHLPTIVLRKEWYIAGADPSTYPQSFHPAELIVVSPVGLRRYENNNRVSMDHGLHKCAFGAGKDFAYGALGMNATAKQAVEIACKYSMACGHGAKVFEIR